ncbi:DUF4383 domain-containing protein [Kineococcus sp. GCM10028916]|uniref:DUF4383 domain-containing protein n=1 Tax=Kineococcus sp. GCM10028916 TaxID=3273394 RepID=UPI003626B1E0
MSLNMSGAVTRSRPRVTAAQHLSLIVGVLLILLGVVGFFVSGFSDWTGGTKEQQVVGLAVNPLSNVLHLVLGVLGVLARTGARRARWYGVFLLLAGGAWFAYGAVDADGGGPPFNLNWPMSTVHAVLAVGGLVMAFVPVRTAPRPSTAELD